MHAYTHVQMYTPCVLCTGARVGWYMPTVACQRTLQCTDREHPNTTPTRTMPTVGAQLRTALHCAVSCVIGPGAMMEKSAATDTTTSITIDGQEIRVDACRVDVNLLPLSELVFKRFKRGRDMAQAEAWLGSGPLSKMCITSAMLLLHRAANLMSAAPLHVT